MYTIHYSTIYPNDNAGWYHYIRNSYPKMMDDGKLPEVAIEMPSPRPPATPRPMEDTWNPGASGILVYHYI